MEDLCDALRNATYVRALSSSSSSPPPPPRAARFAPFSSPTSSFAPYVSHFVAQNAKEALQVKEGGAARNQEEVAKARELVKRLREVGGPLNPGRGSQIIRLLICERAADASRREAQGLLGGRSSEPSSPSGAPLERLPAASAAAPSAARS